MRELNLRELSEQWWREDFKISFFLFHAYIHFFFPFVLTHSLTQDNFLEQLNT